jgi:hypothetical protein
MDSERVVDILDKFLQIYNTKFERKGSLFENVNMKDPSSTNDKMELFYEYMKIHDDLEKENKLYVDVYDPSDSIPNNDYDIYALIENRNKKIKYISLSFISLLFVGTEEFSLNDGWSIIKL